MKRFNLSLTIILLSLFFTTACQANTFFDQGQSQQINHSEITHTVTPKPLPERYRFELISDLNLQANSAILVNAINGDVLLDKNSDEPLAIASMSKIMTELLVLEALDEGIIDWDDAVDISDYAYTISHQPGFASIKLDQDQLYSVHDLFHGMAITSANGATIALAEKVAGSEKAFVNLMNDKAKELDLTNTSFVNSTGLTNSDLQNNHSFGSIDDSNEMSASDLATLTKHILDHYPELLELTSQPEFTIQDKTFQNSNWMLPGSKGNLLDVDVTFPEVDGLKTGFTSDAGYGFTGTVQIDGTRFISVVIGTDAIEERFTETGKIYKAVLDQVK